MAEVVRGDEPRAGCLREPQQRFVVGVGQPRSLHCRELKAIGRLTDRIEKTIHFLVRESERAGVAFQHFLVFEQQVIT